MENFIAKYLTQSSEDNFSFSKKNNLLFLVNLIKHEIFFRNWRFYYLKVKFREMSSASPVPSKAILSYLISSQIDIQIYYYNFFLTKKIN